MSRVATHKHSVTDFPTGNGDGQVPLASSLRTCLLTLSLVNSGTVASTVALTALTGTGAWTIPANTGRSGEVIEYEATGDFGVTGTPTLAIAVSIGGVNRGTVTSAAQSTGGNWKIRVEIACGAGGTARITTTTIIGTTTLVAYDDQGFDPTIANELAVSVQWSASSASNTTTQRTRRAQRWATFTETAA